MVKFYSTTYTYDYNFSAVALAYFLRYPNPYSLHVASTDTISRHFDADTQRLTTVRLHLKRSRMPPAVLKLLPKSSIRVNAGADGVDGNSQSFILEKSVVDVREGWMETESRNLDWNNVLSVIERHSYRRPNALSQNPLADIEDRSSSGIVLQKDEDRTDVNVSVMLKSRIGEHIRKRRQRWGEQASATSIAGGEVEEVKPGWFSSWSSGPVRSAIEAISLQRTERSQPKARKGMSVVLDRLRRGGLEAVLEGMRCDREVEV